MIFEKKSNGQTHVQHTNTNPVKNTKIRRLYLIEIGWVERCQEWLYGVRGGGGSWEGVVGGHRRGLNRIKHDF